MYYRGKMFGFVHLYSGQEAVSTGVIRALRPDDYICSTYRDHVHALSKDVPPREVGNQISHSFILESQDQVRDRQLPVWA